MANYKIDLSDGSETITIPENVVDKDTTSVALVGHGQPNYGQPQNENFVHMLEHFASEDEPNMPIRGQIWFKKNPDGKTYEMRICRQKATQIDEVTKLSDAKWDKIFKTAIDGAGEEENYSDGDIWYDFSTHQLKIFDTTIENALSKWNIIGPHDPIHNDSTYASFVTSYSQPRNNFHISSSYFTKNVINDTTTEGEGENKQLYTGSVHLVTLRVLMKEVPSPNITYDASNLRSAVFIYRFTVRTTSFSSGDGTQPSYIVSLAGAPNYEILSKSDNLDFTMNIDLQSNSVIFTIDNQSIPNNNTYFVNGVDMDIIRV